MVVIDLGLQDFQGSDPVFGGLIVLEIRRLSAEQDGSHYPYFDFDIESLSPVSLLLQSCILMFREADTPLSITVAAVFDIQNSNPRF